MALPTLDATFASAADLPRRQMLAKWLVNLQYSGSIEDYWTLPEHYLWAKIAVAAGAPRSEADYISLPKNYVWSDLYNAVSGSSGQTIDRGEKEAIGWIAAAVRGDASDPAKVATYISWPWRYQVASIITALAVDANAQSFITTSGATDVEGIDQFVKGVKNLGLWNSMVCWPLRSSQNAGTGTTAYSLGGLGTFNGTLVNGPTWGANGIDINAAISPTPSIDINPSPLSDFANGHSWFVVMNPTGPNPMSGTTVDQWVATQTTSVGGILLQAGAVGTGSNQGFLINARTQTERRLSASATLGFATVRNKFGFLATNAAIAAASTYKYSNETLAASTPAAPTVVSYSGTNLRIFANGDGRNTSAFVLVTTPQFNLSASLQTALENLYKTTLGNGLGLP